jgi:CRP-like cAMP-binding protein
MRGLAGERTALTPRHTRDELRRILRTRFGIQEGETSFLDALTPARLVKGQRLSVRDHALAILGIVSTGCLRVYFTEADGSDRVLYFAPEGWCVADVHGFTGDCAMPLVIDALETTEVWLFDGWGRTMRDELTDCERVCRSLAESALRTLQKRLVGSMRKTAAQRYLEFQELYPGLDCRISQYHVAAYLGISPEFLSKMRTRLIRHAARCDAS